MRAEPKTQSKFRLGAAIVSFIALIAGSAFVYAITSFPLTDAGSFVSLALGVLAVASTAVGTFILFDRGTRGYDEQVDTERERLKAVTSDAVKSTGIGYRELLERYQKIAEDAEASTLSTTTRETRPSGEPRLDVNSRVSRLESDLQGARFTNLLIEYYAHGLVEARSSSTNSRRSSWLGMLVIAIGVILAILSGATRLVGNGVQISLIVSGSGVITNAVGILFHRQANKALAHMEKQTSRLQTDMWSDQDRRVAIDLIGKISTQSLRDQLLAGLVLELSHAKLPSIQGMHQTNDNQTPPRPTS